MRPQRIALFSDTHNLLRPSLLKVLDTCDQWIHAGDICREQVWETLRLHAGERPLVGVRGNNDVGVWAQQLPLQTVVKLGHVPFLLMHDVSQLSVAQLASEQWRGVISGHSHRLSHEKRSGKLLLNPGSAGPKRFKLTSSMWVVEVDGGALTFQAHDLEVEDGPWQTFSAQALGLEL